MNERELRPLINLTDGRRSKVDGEWLFMASLTISHALSCGLLYCMLFLMCTFKAGLCCQLRLLWNHVFVDEGLPVSPVLCQLHGGSGSPWVARSLR